MSSGRIQEYLKKSDNKQKDSAPLEKNIEHSIEKISEKSREIFTADIFKGLLDTVSVAYGSFNCQGKEIDWAKFHNTFNFVDLEYKGTKDHYYLIWAKEINKKVAEGALSIELTDDSSLAYTGINLENKKISGSIGQGILKKKLVNEYDFFIQKARIGDMAAIKGLLPQILNGELNEVKNEEKTEETASEEKEVISPEPQRLRPAEWLDPKEIYQKQNQKIKEIEETKKGKIITKNSISENGNDGSEDKGDYNDFVLTEENIKLHTIYFMLQILEKMPEKNIEKLPNDLTIYFLAAFSLSLRQVLFFFDEAAPVIDYLNTVAQFFNVERDKLKKTIAWIIREVNLPVSLSEDIHERFEPCPVVEKVNSELSEKIIEKADRISRLMTETIDSISDLYQKKFEPHLKTYREYLENKKSDSSNAKKKALEKFDQIKKGDISSAEKIKIFAELFEKQEFRATLKVGCGRNFWWHVVAVITVLPAIILAVQSKLLSSKKTINFSKSHSEIFLEQVDIFHKNHHVVKMLVEKIKDSQLPRPYLRS